MAPAIGVIGMTIVGLVPFVKKSNSPPPSRTQAPAGIHAALHLPFRLILRRRSGGVHDIASEVFDLHCPCTRCNFCLEFLVWRQGQALDDCGELAREVIDEFPPRGSRGPRGGDSSVQLLILLTTKGSLLERPAPIATASNCIGSLKVTAMEKLSAFA